MRDAKETELFCGVFIFSSEEITSNQLSFPFCLNNKFCGPGEAVAVIRTCLKSSYFLVGNFSFLTFKLEVYIDENFT